MTINGRANGEAIIAFPATSSAPDLSGYAIGAISGTPTSGRFTGTTWHGHPATVDRGGNQLSGTMTFMRGTTATNIQPTRLVFACEQVW